jgi:hypothetical protein
VLKVARKKGLKVARKERVKTKVARKERVKSVTICIAGSGEGVNAAHRPVAQLKMVFRSVKSHIIL